MTAAEFSTNNTALIEKLADCFYKVVPDQYRTYCAFTSKIIQNVLGHFGMTCERVPCQIWYSKPNHMYVIGFLGKSNPEKWDGHVICKTGRLLIDTATHHFERDFGLQVPPMVVTPMFEFPTTALAHVNINSTDSLWWYLPPQGADVSLPQEPEDLANLYTAELINRLN